MFNTRPSDPQSLRFTYPALFGRAIAHDLRVVADIYVTITHHDEAAALAARCVVAHDEVAAGRKKDKRRK